MSKDQENTFMGEWTPEEWLNFEKDHINKLNLSSRKNDGIKVAINYSRKVIIPYPKVDAKLSIKVTPN